MWKLSRRVTGATRARPRAAAAWIAALTLGGSLVLPASAAFACDDDYGTPVGWQAQGAWNPGPAPGPTVVVIEDRDGGDRYRERRHAARARRYWY